VSSELGECHSVFVEFAEFERNLIRKRVVAGQNRAKAKGVKLGSLSKMNDGLQSAIQLLRENGMGIKQVAKDFGVGIGAVYSVIKKLKFNNL
jgi:DNA invertase Pin-like site-specific DNA recombinase